jgi:cytochrome P450
MDESKQNEIHCFKEVTTKVPHWLGILIISDYIPSLRWLVRLQGIEGSLHALRHKKSQFIQKLIAEHKNLTIEIDQVKDFGNENVAKTPKDFVDILLSAPQEDGTGNLSDETIETLILEMLAGGAETSSLTIEWAMAELIRNPMIMRRAQMELETVVGMNRIIEESDLHKLTYLRAVIKETFRLHPPAPLLVPHSSTSKICGIAKGYDIPPHARVMVNVWAMGRDPSIWERPFEFCPERFLQQGQEHHHIAAEIIDMDEKNFKLFPFGSGRRACPGRPLGILVVQIVLARLLHSFHWVLPNHQEPNTLDMSKEFGLTLPRAQQLHLKAYPKLQAHLYK